MAVGDLSADRSWILGDAKRIGPPRKVVVTRALAVVVWLSLGPGRIDPSSLSVESSITLTRPLGLFVRDDGEESVWRVRRRDCVSRFCWDEDRCGIATGIVWEGEAAKMV